MEKMVTLKEYREYLQSCIDESQKEKVLEGITLLKELGLTINAVIEDLDDKTERIKNTIKEQLVNKGLSKTDANSIVTQNYKENQSVDSFMENILKQPFVRNRIKNKN